MSTTVATNPYLQGNYAPVTDEVTAVDLPVEGELPDALTGYIHDREGYDYLHHAEVGSTNATFVEDQVVDRFTVIGSVAEHRDKLMALAEAGVTQFNIYLMNGEEEETLEVYGREIIPAMRESSGARD